MNRQEEGSAAVPGWLLGLAIAIGCGCVLCSLQAAYYWALGLGSQPPTTDGKPLDGSPTEPG